MALHHFLVELFVYYFALLRMINIYCTVGGLYFIEIVYTV